MVVVVKRNTSLKQLRVLLKRARPKKAKGFDAKRFNGALKLRGDPLKVQRMLRDEWN